MYRRLSRKQEIFRRVLVYTLMSLTVITTASLIVLFTLGYRFDSSEGRLQQGSLVQFGSTPSGATVSIDGVAMGSRTPSKSSILPGQHNFAIWRDGYELWEKTINIKAGTLTWLNYALLVPKKLTVEPVEVYGSLHASLATMQGREILLQRHADTPQFNLIDLRSDSVQSETLTIPSSVYSTTPNSEAPHNFSMASWDRTGRYVLIRHTHGDTKEWLVLDTRESTSTRNITELFNLDIKDIKFAGSGGTVLYALVADATIRRLDISSSNTSSPLVSNVTNFDTYEDGNIISYVGTAKSGTEKVAGLYREGDEGPRVIRSIDSSSDTSLHIATTNYFNDDYVAIAEGKKVDILNGNYPNDNADISDLRTFASFTLDRDVKHLGFSPDGQYMLAQSDEYFSSYDLEYQSLASSSIEGEGTTSRLRWLDDNYIWSDRGGTLTIREFDGANSHTINKVAQGHDAYLTHNGRYVYSIGVADGNYQLQRVRLILP